MAARNINPREELELFVKQISIFESETDTLNILPFFADGYPGIMFQQTDGCMVAEPHGKSMPELFLYGQTLNPVELVLKGRYKLVSFQLYPFVLESFFGIAPKSVNDDCFDLTFAGLNSELVEKLRKAPESESRVKLLSQFLEGKYMEKRGQLDFSVAEAIKFIVNKMGQVIVSDICEKLGTSERALERKFQSAVGVSPKQFATIIRFQQSFQQLSSNDFSKLTDIVYANGYSDQSHFIKVFKAFTGKTPKFFAPR